MNSFQQTFGRAEIGQEIRYQCEIITGPEIDAERIAWNGMKSIQDAGTFCIALRDCKHLRPFDGKDLRLSITLGELNAIESVATRNIEYLDRTVRSLSEAVSQQTR